MTFCADEDLDILLSKSCHKSVYRTGESVVVHDTQCHSLLLLTSGSVRCEKRNAEDQADVVADFKAPLALMPELLFATRGRYMFDVVANEGSEVWHIDRENFFGFMQTHPSVLRIFLQTISDKSVNNTKTNKTIYRL